MGRSARSAGAVAPVKIIVAGPPRVGVAPRTHHGAFVILYQFPNERALGRVPQVYFH